MNIDNREPSVLRLIERLEDLSYSNIVAFGQQNAAHIGVSLKAHDGTESDVKNLVGRHPAIVGIDTLSFYGYEGSYDDLIKIVKQLNREGVIITLSSHMPNFSLGGDEFFDYTPNITEGNIGYRILPGGDLNAKYLRFLDRIADFAQACIDVSGERIPMIFRPFHEDNGDWFWWGAKHLPDDKYVTLFRYTIDYLSIDCGIKNFLYAYSPNGFFDNEKQYLKRYPGDDYIDIMGMDMYNDRPHKKDAFFEKLNSSLAVIGRCALEHGKVYALTEIGLRTLDTAADGKYYEGLAPADNEVKDWFTKLLNSLMMCEAGQRIAYALVWSNFSDTQFWAPYKTDTFTHEMTDDFLAFLNDKRILLAPTLVSTQNSTSSDTTQN